MKLIFPLSAALFVLLAGCQTADQPTGLTSGQNPDARGQGEAAQPPEIKQFVSQTFIHGVPYEQASKYDSTQVPALLEMLANPQEEAKWPNVVVTLGIIGDQQAVQPLIDFTQKGEGKLSHAQYAAKTGALMALGYTVNKSGDERALTYLKEGLNPAAWAQRNIAWVSPYHATAEERNLELTKASIFGLALSGHPSAAEALRSLAEPIQTEGTKGVREQLKELAAEALREHAIIAERGLANYYRERKR